MRLRSRQDSWGTHGDTALSGLSALSLLFEGFGGSAVDQSFGRFVVGLWSPDDKKVIDFKKSTFFPVGQANRGIGEAVECGLTEKRSFPLGRPAGGFVRTVPSPACLAHRRYHTVREFRPWLGPIVGAA